MKTLIEQIKSDQIASRKAYDAKKSSLLTTLIGEAVAIGKNDGNREVTDPEVIAVIKKFIKNMNETLGYLGDKNIEVKVDILMEIDTLSEYLPKQLSEQELCAIINRITFSVGKNMGKIMQELRTHFDGRYDGKLASTIVKRLIS